MQAAKLNTDEPQRVDWDTARLVFPEALTAQLAAMRHAIKSRFAIEDQLIEGLARMLPDGRIVRKFYDFGPDLTKAWGAISRDKGADYLSAVNKVLVLELALSLPIRVRALRLPPSVLADYPAAMARMLDYMAKHNAYDCSVDPFLKDFRLVAALSVPCGSRVIDLNGEVGKTLSLHYWLRHPSASALRGLSLRNGLEPWLFMHIDYRSVAGLAHLADFNETRWDSCFRIIADLLACNPQLLGLVGASWFYDPALEEVSPNLTYLRKRPLERGAFLVKGKSTPFARESATSASAKRRKLMEAGTYVPCSYSIVWPRHALMAWAGVED